GMVMDLMEAGTPHDVFLIFGCPYRTDLIYADYFEEMHEQYDQFHYMPCISRENRRSDGSKKYVQTSLWDHEGVLDPILKKENTLMYICGLKGVERSVYRTLAQKGLWEYLDIRKKAQGKSPDEWDENDLRRYI